MTALRSILGYGRTFIALVVGIILGGVFPDLFSLVANATTALIQFIVRLVPVLIFVALSPAIATLVKRGLAGRFACSVVLWYVLSSAVAGMMGVGVSSLIFRIPFSSNEGTDISEVTRMIQAFGEQGSASMPLLAIIGATVLGAAAVRIPALYEFLRRIGTRVSGAGQKLSYVMIPIVFCLGVTIGVNFGTQIGMQHYLLMVLYNAFLCFLWWLFYVFLIIKWLQKGRCGLCSESTMFRLRFLLLAHVLHWPRCR